MRSVSGMACNDVLRVRGMTPDLERTGAMQCPVRDENRDENVNESETDAESVDCTQTHM